MTYSCHCDCDIIFEKMRVMPTYTFKTGLDEYITVDAIDINEALNKAGIDVYDTYELIESDEFEDRCLISAITDEILFGE